MLYGHASLGQLIQKLESQGTLIRVREPVDPNLFMGMVQRRFLKAYEGAVLFEHVLGTRYPCLANLFGTTARVEQLLQPGVDLFELLAQLKAQKFGWHQLKAGAKSLWNSRNSWVRQGSMSENWEKIALADLPLITSWPDDGGPFITLPAVYSEDPSKPGWMNSNLGMYRVQLQGDSYRQEQEVGLHYQIHRGIGVHHQKALAKGARLPVSIHVGGPASLTFSAVMPLPEGFPEVAFAAYCNARPLTRVLSPAGVPFIDEAEFVITGFIDTRTALEGPFGDHLGYYSLAHPFPVVEVEGVWAKPDSIWPFTTVGRPPQEDSNFGAVIHHMTDPLIPKVLPMVTEIHAVDAAGVHPLLLAKAKERYEPYRDTERPQELLTAAMAILGQGQLSLAKYLFVVDESECRSFDLNQTEAFFSHVLSRVNWGRDLHFITQTTIDTLDYSSPELNVGSKVIVAARGKPVRVLGSGLVREPQLSCFHNVRYVSPGILAVDGLSWSKEDKLCELLEDIPQELREQFPLWVICDDADFVAQSWDNFLWVTFTRSDPARDITGLRPWFYHKHWGCEGPLLIDARIKPFHAPELKEKEGYSDLADEFVARHVV